VSLAPYHFYLQFVLEGSQSLTRAEANDVLDKLCSLVSDIELFLGNHEERLSRHLKRHPELYGLKALEWENLLGLKGRGIKLHKYSEAPYLYHGL